jgi:hypothetical protein
MRVAHSLFSLSPLTMMLAALATACGGATPAPDTAADSKPAASEAATPEAAAPTKPAAEDEGWVGEKTTKNDDSAAKDAPANAEASPANGKAVVETRTMDVIRKVVMDNRKAARKCYDDARKDLKDLKGDVVIHFVLDPEGKVKLAEVNQERSTLKAPPVTDCVLGVIKAIKFPPSSRGMETSTNYPFNFTP